MLGIGIWLAIDKIFISDIIGTDLFDAGVYLVIICGVFMLLLSLFGCFSTVRMKRMFFMIVSYIKSLSLIEGN